MFISSSSFFVQIFITLLLFMFTSSPLSLMALVRSVRDTCRPLSMSAMRTTSSAYTRLLCLTGENTKSLLKWFLSLPVTQPITAVFPVYTQRLETLPASLCCRLFQAHKARYSVESAHAHTHNVKMTRTVLRYGTVDLLTCCHVEKLRNGYIHPTDLPRPVPTASHLNGLGLLMLHHKGLYTVNCFPTRPEPVS